MTDIAIVGMSCRLPGAPDIAAYRDLLTAGHEGLHRMASSTFPIPVVGRVHSALEVDHEALGLGAADALIMDPQHRVFAECAKDALDAAGHGAGEARGVVGVYAGAGLSGYLVHNLAGRFVATGGADPADSLNLHTGNVADYLPLRIAHILGLNGPALAIGATCATSLVAVHVAVQALLGYECDTALAGGVSLQIPHPDGYVALPDGPFSQDGHTRSYSKGASGTVFTDGAGCVVLRRLDDAVRDGDTIHAVIRGSAVTNDGAQKVGFTAPTVAGQVAAIEQALAVADLDPRDIGVIEGHGTATMLGDAIEIAALREVAGQSAQPWCALGSAKSNIGHTSSAAGVAGLIKAVLAVRDGVIFPTVHADPVPDLDGSAFYLPPGLQQWDSPMRRAGVSSFGIGGANCHVVLEEPPRYVPAPQRPDPHARHLVAISAASRSAALAWRDEVTKVAGSTAASGTQIADIAATTVHGRARMPHGALAVLDDGGNVLATSDAVARDNRVILAFPGADAQRRGMMSGAITADPELRDRLAEVAAEVRVAGGPDTYELLTDATSDDLLPSPAVGLPTLFAAEVAMGLRLLDVGVRIDAVIGHSVGEYAAAVIAGGLSLPDAAMLVVARSEAMAKTTPGRMLAVALDEAAMLEVLRRHPGVDLAAVNGPTACVAAGAIGDIERLASDLDQSDVRTALVGIDVAAHSRLIEPARAIIDEVGARLTPRSLDIPLFSTLQGRQVTTQEWHDPHRWGDHLRATVRFADALEAAIGDQEVIVVVGGPGTSVATAARSVGTTRVAAVVAPFGDDMDGDSAVDVLSAYGELWAHGAGVDLTAVTGPVRRRVTLPTYPYQRRRMYVESQPRSVAAAGPGSSEPSAAEPLQVPTWRELPPATEMVGPVSVIGEGPLAQQLREYVDRGADAVSSSGAAHALAVAIDTTRGGSDAERLTNALTELGDLARQLASAAEIIAEDESISLICLHNGADDAVAAALVGAIRVLGQEVPRLRWRIVEVDDSSWRRGAILTELGDLVAGGRTGWEITLRNGRRAVRTWQSWRPSPAATEPIVRGQSVLITGGLGSVGLRLAERWGLEFGVRIVLASRRVGALEQSSDERSIEQRNAVAELRRRGVDLELVQLDVADTQAFGRVVEQLTRERGRLDVVIHAPVSLELAPLSELDQEPLEASLAAKVRGVNALESAIDRLPPAQRPPRVVLMSSAAGTIGGFGLAAYVAASRYLDEVARRRHDDGWLALDWDRWRFGTAAEAEAISEITMKNAMDADDALNALERVLKLPDSPPQIAISPSALDPRSVALPRRAALTPGGEADLRTANERLVASVWSSVLGTEIRSRDDDFFAQGGHSLLATRVLAELREQCGARLRLRDLLRAPTVAALAELLEADAPHPVVDVSTALDVVDATEPAVEHRTSDESGPRAPRLRGTTPSAPFGLTRVQTAYLLGRQDTYDLGGVACQFFLEIACPDIDVDRYTAAWQRVVDRHEMLRTVIDEAGRNHPLNPPPEATPRVHDLTAHSPASASEDLKRLRDAAAHRVADPRQWPLVEPIVVLMPDGGHRLLIAVDVLVCDSASWMLIDREMRAIYEDPAVDLPNIDLTFADCITAMEADAHGPERAEAWEYWNARIEELPSAPSIDVSATASNAMGRPRFVRRRTTIDAAIWDVIKRCAAEHRITPTALVLAAYADILQIWSGQAHFAITTTVFDRPDLPGVENVVGEFSSLLLLERKPSHSQDLVHAASALQRQLHADLIHSSVSALEVLAEEARRTGKQRNVPVVFTSMIGLDATDDGGHHDTEWLGEIVDGVSQTPQTWLDHQAFEHRGDLVLQWDVNEAAVDPRAADDMFTQYAAGLAALAEGEWLRDTSLIGVCDSEDSQPGRAAPDPTADSATAPVVIDAVREVWADLLGVDAASIGSDDSFLALGGDSLLAVRMAAMLAERTSYTLPLTAVRSETTVSELVAALRDGESAAFDTHETVATRPPEPVNSSSEVQPRTGGAQPAALPAGEGRPFPLTALQRAYWLGQQSTWDVPACPASVLTVVPLRGVDAVHAYEQLRTALSALVRRHEMLRVRIADDGTQVLRDVDDPTCTPRVDVIDQHGLDAEHTTEERPPNDNPVAALLDDWAREVPHLDLEPAVRAAVVLDGQDQARLITRFSLLAIDGWSTALIDRDLAALLAGDPLPRPPAAGAVAHYLQRATERRDTDLDWWRAYLADRPAPPRLATTGRKPSPAMIRREARLDAHLHRALADQARARGLTLSAVTMIALARALRTHTGQDQMLLTTLHSRREALHPDVLELVGPLSTTALVPVDLRGSGDLRDQAKALGATLADIGAHLSVSAIEVGRELSQGAERSRPIAPFVVQSTLGMNNDPDLERSSGALGFADAGALSQRVSTPHIHGEFRAFALGGELIADIALREGMYEPHLASELIANTMATLRDLAAGRGWTETGASRSSGFGAIARRSEQDELLSEVCDQWSTLLGCVVGPDDDFFELGGDSLLLVRALRAHADIEVQPSQLLTEPTPRRLTELLRSGDERQTSDISVNQRVLGRVPEDSVVHLSSGSGDPLFLIHPSGGDVSCYLSILRLTGLDRPVLAIADPGLNGHRWPQDLDEVVRRYAATIADTQPNGAITVGGWSMGGALAHAVAVELRRIGRDVAQLIMIDSTCPERIVAIEGLDADATTSAQRMRFLRSIQAYLGVRASAPDVEGLQSELIELGAFVGMEAAEARFVVFDRHLRGLADHLATRLDETVPVLLVRAADRAPYNGRLGMGVDDALDDDALGWRPYVDGELTVRTAPGHHYSVIRDDGARVVAAELDRVLRGGSTRAQSSTPLKGTQ
ncbi:type I polyketide synthase [Cumulibacter soli]|uniref:type I polyketide synthase n=1 Tax=Cumulibacter soli TaxID=2546344 RepID=UPI001068CF2F|nr:type I polyketide synthase [Cumulibacter soli]